MKGLLTLLLLICCSKGDEVPRQCFEIIDPINESRQVLSFTEERVKCIGWQNRTPLIWNCTWTPFMDANPGFQYFCPACKVKEISCRK